MKRGDIYLVNLDPTMGHEQKGTRPVLIISPQDFNTFTQTPIVLPITTKSNFARIAGFAVSLDSCGTKTKGIVRCDQMRTLDLPARGAKKLESVPPDIIEEVMAILESIFDFGM